MRKWGVLLLAAMLLTALALGAGAEEFFAEESFGGEESFTNEGFFEEEFFAEEPGEGVTEEALPEEPVEELEDRSIILFENETISADEADADWATIQPEITATVKKKKISLAWTFKDPTTGADVKLPKDVKFYIYRVERSNGFGWTDQAKTTTEKKYSYTAKKPGDYTFYVRAEYVKKGVERYGTFGKITVNVPSTGEWKKIKKITAVVDYDTHWEYDPELDDYVANNSFVPVMDIYSNEAPDAFEISATVKHKGEKTAIAVEPVTYDLEDWEIEDLTVGRSIRFGYWYFDSAPELKTGSKITFTVKPVIYDEENNKVYGKAKKSNTLTMKAPKASSSSSSASWKKAPTYVYAEQIAPLKVRLSWEHMGASSYLIHGIGKTPIEYTPGEYEYGYYTVELDVPKAGTYKLSVQPVGWEYNKKKDMDVQVKGKKSKAAKVKVVPPESLILAGVEYYKSDDEKTITIKWNSYADSVDRFEVFLADATHQKELSQKISYDPNTHQYSATFDTTVFTTERGNFTVKAITEGEVMASRNMWGLYITFAE